MQVGASERRTSAFRRALTAALVATALAFSAVARAADATEDGAVAPVDGWSSEAGCASRTASALTRPLTGPLEAGWSQTLPGEIAAEPLVVGPHAVLDVAAPAGQRTLTWLSVADGSPFAKRQIRSPVPLLPSAVGSVVVVRTGPTRVGAYRLRGPQVIEIWNVDVGEPVESLVALGVEVYVRTRAGVARWDIGSRTPAWTACREPSGRLAARGAHVYALDRVDEELWLCALDRATGRQAATARIGHAAGDDGARISVQSELVYVQLSVGVETTTGDFARGVLVPRRAAGGGVTLGESALYLAREDLFGWDREWLLPVTEPKGAALYQGTAGLKEVRLLATKDSHSEWLSGTPLASAASRVLYHPQGALELETGRILWRPRASGLFRPVPTRGLLLYVEKGGVLRTVRQAGGARAERPPEAVGGGLGGEPAAARAVLRDGTIAAGRIRRDGGTFVLEGKPPRSIAAADVLLVTDGAGRVLHAASGDAIAAAVETLAAERIGVAAGAALVGALGSRDPGLLQRLHARALLSGAPAADLEQAEKRIKNLLKSPNKLPGDPGGEAAALAAFAGADRIPAQVSAELLSTLPADAPPSVAVDLLRVVLRADRGNADAAARVRSMLPEGVSPAEPFDALEWLEFVDAVRQTPVEVVRPVPASHPGITREQRAVSLQALHWREDVVGLRSAQLLIVTPVRRPGAIARCLSLGELVCTSLEGWFAGGTRKRDKREPLVLLLYPSEEEYLKESARSGHDVSWTAGHYSPDDEVSRLFLPADDHAFAAVTGVFAHELTHQWIDQRCPYFGLADRSRSSRTAGYWIVEGFATFVEQLLLDPRERTWAFDPGAQALEIVGVAPRDQLIPWRLLLSIDPATFHEIDREPKFRFPLVRRLGYQRVLSATHVFYEQSAATCAFLFEGDGGAHRQKLLEFLGAYYRGETPTPEQAFGMSADELGRRVVEFAKSQALR